MPKYGKSADPYFITQKVWASNWEKDIASLRVFMVSLHKKEKEIRLLLDTFKLILAKGIGC